MDHCPHESYYYGDDDCDKRTASVREKKRMCSINVAFVVRSCPSAFIQDFQELRNYIPTFPFEKRLSKIDTLNLAIAYIHMLNDLLQSPIEPHRYIRKCVAMAKNGNSNAPCWSTSGQSLLLYIKLILFRFGGPSKLDQMASTRNGTSGMIFINEVLYI